MRKGESEQVKEVYAQAIFNLVKVRSSFDDMCVVKDRVMKGKLYLGSITQMFSCGFVVSLTHELELWIHNKRYAYFSELVEVRIKVFYTEEVVRIRKEQYDKLANINDEGVELSSYLLKDMKDVLEKLQNTTDCSELIIAQHNLKRHLGMLTFYKPAPESLVVEGD
jgi:hypothetical protein